MTSGKSSRLLSTSILALALAVPGITRAENKPPVFEEKDGIVAFEAETGAGNWRVIETPTGKGIQDPGEGRMVYTIRFAQPGKYYVFLLAKQGPLGKDKENDVRLLLGGEKLWASDGATRPDGMRSNGDWKWTKFPKGPGAHTPRTFFRDPVYFVVSEPGELTFEIIHRSANYAIDRVVLKRDDPNPPTALDEYAAPRSMDTPSTPPSAS
jgi:hypothetical protein